MFDLVFSRRFAMGHRLTASGSEKCATPHGHNETVTVRLRAVRPAPLDGEANMAEPFERAKATWHRWIDDHVDHAFQLSQADPLLDWFIQREPHRLDRILITPGDPTTEALACCMMAKLNAFLASDGGRLFCAEIRIEETPTNTVSFDGDPLAALPDVAGADRWWLRADMSINDLRAAPNMAAPRIAAVAR
jgi:6-pyruvoyltetrahydropterin/6-carboxytetrahydropterin synthase